MFITRKEKDLIIETLARIAIVCHRLKVDVEELQQYNAMCRVEKMSEILKPTRNKKNAKAKTKKSK